jgi:hypothetical protein
MPADLGYWAGVSSATSFASSTIQPDVRLVPDPVARK